MFIIFYPRIYLFYVFITQLHVLDEIIYICVLWLLHTSKFIICLKYYMFSISFIKYVVYLYMYRTIMFGFLSKCLLYLCVYDLDSHFDDTQCGCRSGRSSMHALLSLLHNTIGHLDKGNYVRWLMIVLKKLSTMLTIIS